MSVLSVLEEARAVLAAQPGLWKKFDYREAPDNTCAVLALDDVGGSASEHAQAVRALALAIDPDSIDVWLTVVNFNDAEATTKADVLAVYDRAIAAVDAQ